MSNIESSVPGGGNRAIRLGVDASMGHGCFAPVVAVAGSSDVFHNMIPSVRLTDPYAVHCCGPVCHSGVVSMSSQSVFINQLSQHMSSDMISCGDIAGNGSMDTFNM